MPKTRNASTSACHHDQPFRLLVQHVKDYAIFMIDTGGRIKTWNEGAIHINGYAELEILGKHISILYREQDVDRGLAEQNMEKAKEIGRWEQEGWRKRKDGSLFWANVVFTAIYDEKNQLTGFALVTRDITDRRQFRQNLLRKVHQKSRQLTQVFDRVTDAFVAFDKNWNYTFVNRVAAEILGRASNELIGKNIWLGFPEWEESPIYQKFLAAMEEQKATQIEDYFAPSDLWFSAVLYPSPEGLSVYLQDISQKKRAEIKLHHSYNQYRRIVETAQEGIWLIDEYHKTVFVNKRMCEILEFSEEELMGRDNFHLLAEKDQKEEAYKTIASKGIKQNEDVTFFTKTGRRIRTNLSANPIYDEKGVYRGALAMITDITEKIKLQEQLIREQITRQKEISKAALCAQEKERTEIAKELHDNINQILTTANMYLELAEENESMRMDMIARTRKNITKSIQEIRALSKSLTEPTLEDIGLADALQELIECYQLFNKFQIHYSCNELLNNVTKHLRTTIFRVVQEQLNNIAKHSNAKKIWITIELSGEEIYMLVKDDGKGFDTKLHRKGIGITNIKNRVELNSGTMQLTSAVGKGCSLEIRIPYSEKEPPIFNIIVVQDDVNDQHVIVEAFDAVAPNHKTTFVNDGKKLVNLLDALPNEELPSLIVLDYQVSIQNGLEILRVLKLNERTRFIPKVIYSTSVNLRGKEQYYTYNACVFIEKGTTFTEIKENVRQMLSFCN